MPKEADGTHGRWISAARKAEGGVSGHAPQEDSRRLLETQQRSAGAPLRGGSERVAARRAGSRREEGGGRA